MSQVHQNPMLMRDHEDCIHTGWQGRKNTSIASSVCVYDALYHWTSFVKQTFQHKGIKIFKMVVAEH